MITLGEHCTGSVNIGSRTREVGNRTREVGNRPREVQESKLELHDGFPRSSLWNIRVTNTRVSCGIRK